VANIVAYYFTTLLTVSAQHAPVPGMKKFKKIKFKSFLFLCRDFKGRRFFVIFVTNFQFLFRFFSFQFSISFSSGENRFFGLIIILDRLSV